LLDRPPEPRTAAALATLRQLGLLDDDEALTPLGRHLAQLPADLHVGKWCATSAKM